MRHALLGLCFSLLCVLIGLSFALAAAGRWNGDVKAVAWFLGWCMVPLALSCWVKVPGMPSQPTDKSGRVPPMPPPRFVPPKGPGF